MESLKFALRNKQVTVATAGTKVAVASSPLWGRGVALKAKASNAGVVYVGDATVSASAGFGLAAGEAIYLSDLLGTAEKAAAIDLSQVYCDAATNGDKVMVAYFDYLL